jgi:ADP-heptose:LPS heptosyltransferase
MICALPAMHAIRQAYPDAQLSLLTSPGRKGAVGAAELLDGAKWLDELLVYHTDDFATLRQRLKLLRRLRERAYDVWIELPQNLQPMRVMLRNMVTARLAGARWAYGWRLARIRWAAQAQSELLTFPNEVERLLSVIADCGIPSQAAVFPLPISDRDRELVDEVLDHNGLAPQTLVAIAPGAKRSTNRWPLDRFAQVGRHLVREGFQVLIMGGGSDAEDCETVASSIGPGALNLAGQLSLLQSCQLLKRCELLICNDSGVQHLAAAVGTSCLSIFSFWQPRRQWWPYGSQHTVLYKWVECHTCLLDRCPYDNRCIKLIGADEVIAWADRKLAAAKESSDTDNSRVDDSPSTMALPTMTTGSVQGDVRTGLPHVYQAILALFSLNSIWFIWFHRFLPLQDYPDWLYQGFILSKFIRDAHPAAFSLKLYPIPYSTFSVLLAMLDLVLPPETSGKVLLTLMIVGFIFGSLYFLTSLGARESAVLYVPLVLCFNSFFFLGNCSYYLGLSMLFLFSGYLIRTGREANRALVAAMLVVLFMTHFLPYLAAVGVVAILAAHAVKSRGWRESITSLMVTLPSGLLLIWYVLGRLASGDLTQGWIWWNSWHLFVGSFIYAIAPFRTFLPFVTERSPGMKEAALLNVLWAAMAVGAFGAAVRASVFCRGREQAVALCAACFALAYVAAGYIFGGSFTGERFPLPALLFACCWLASLPALTTGRLAMVLRLFFVGVIAVQALWLDTFAAEAAGRLAVVYSEMRAASDSSTLCSNYERYFSSSWPAQGRQGLARFLPNAAGVVRLPYYIYIEKNISAPIFPVALLHYEGPGNYNNLCEDAAPHTAVGPSVDSR